MLVLAATRTSTSGRLANRLWRIPLPVMCAPSQIATMVGRPCLLGGQTGPPEPPGMLWGIAVVVYWVPPSGAASCLHPTPVLIPLWQMVVRGLGQSTPGMAVCSWAGVGVGGPVAGVGAVASAELAGGVVQGGGGVLDAAVGDGGVEGVGQFGGVGVADGPQ
jgi:hypothetical protein